MNVQVNANSAAKSVLDFVKTSGGIAKNTEALELVARICGFDSYRAMRAVSQRESASKKTDVQVPTGRLIETPGRVAFRSELVDWEFSDNRKADLETIPERRRGQYEIVVEDFQPQFRVSIRPVGTTMDNFHGKAVLDLQLEINDGVPCMHMTNDPAGEMLLSVFASGAGLMVRQEEGRHLNLAAAPQPLHDMAIRNGGEFLKPESIRVVSNDTFAGRSALDMLPTTDSPVQVTAPAKIAVEKSKEKFVPWSGEEAIVHFTSAAYGEAVVHAQFNESVGEMLSWIDVAIVDPEFGNDHGVRVQGYSVFNKDDDYAEDRQTFVDEIAVVAAFLIRNDRVQLMRDVVSELILRPDALKLAKDCRWYAAHADSVQRACDAIEALLAVRPVGLVLSGGTEDEVSCRHCSRAYSLDDEGISLGQSCPAVKCKSHKRKPKAN